MEEASKAGIVYLLTNPAMPNLVKIGMTSRENLDARMRELYTTGVPVPFVCEYAGRVENCAAVEAALHTAFGPNRINPQREFFSIEPEQAIVILRLFAREDVTPEVEREIERTATQIDLDSGRRLKKKRPRFNFIEMGIPVDSELKWRHGPETAIVISGTQVRFNDAEMSLTELTTRLLGKDYNVQPGRYWTYNGKALSEIYDETYPSAEDVGL
jgi:hypothetical protein